MKRWGLHDIVGIIKEALQAGDKINAKCYNNNKSEARDLGLWLTTATSRPSSAPTAALHKEIASSSTDDLPEYTVIAGDGICGEKTIYMYRHTGKNTIINNLIITRTPTYTITLDKNGGTTDGTATATANSGNLTYSPRLCWSFYCRLLQGGRMHQPYCHSSWRASEQHRLYQCKWQMDLRI